MERHEGQRHELVRVSREPTTYELVSDGAVTVRAVASGMLLHDGAAFEPVDGPGPWSMKPTRGAASRTWELLRPDGTVHASCEVAHRRRGASAVTVVDGPDDVRLDPTDNAVLDTVRAMALADTGRFALRRGIEVVASTGEARGGRRGRSRLPDGRRRVQILRTKPGASWTPDPVLTCALLVFRTHVLPSFRSF